MWCTYICIRSPYCGEPFQQLDRQARQRWVVFVVNILGQDNYEIVAMAAMLRQGLLQRGHDVRRRLQADDVVGDREGQFDCLDQDLTGTLRATAETERRTHCQYQGSYSFLRVKFKHFQGS